MPYFVTIETNSFYTFKTFPNLNRTPGYLLTVLQAPSFQLEQYIQQQQQPTAAASDAATRMHAAICELEAAVEAGQVHLSTLQQICEQCHEAVLAGQFSNARLDARAPPDPCIFEGMSGDVKLSISSSSTSEYPAEARFLPDAPAPCNSTPATATSVQQTCTGAVTPAAASGKLQGLAPEEVTLLMAAVVHGLQRDMHWMVSAEYSADKASIRSACCTSVYKHKAFCWLQAQGILSGT